MLEKYTVNRDENGIVWFTINRQEKRNAIDYDVIEGFQQTIFEVEANQGDKALVITGSGDRAFCAGGDLSAFQNLRTKQQAYEMLSKMGEILYSIHTLSKPTVALINGICIGGGCELATACDFRIASQVSKIGFVQGTLGITTGWGGATMLLEKLPYAKAMEFLMTATVISAQQGLEVGFVHKIVDSNRLQEECLSFLIPIVSKETNVLRAYKMVANQKWGIPFKEKMFAEIEQCAILWETDEHHQAVDRFLKKS